MREIRTLLVDDEPLANEGLRTLLARHPDFVVVGEYGDGASAALEVRQNPPDVIFLDAQMPEMDGFSMLRELGDDELPLPLVVFVTAHDDYALRAFDAHAVDYLLKPVDDERFDRTVGRVRRQLQGARAVGLQQQLLALLADRESQPAPITVQPIAVVATHTGPREEQRYLTRITVHSGRRSIAVAVEDIDWIAADDYCVNLMVHGRRHVLRASLTSLEAKLDPAMFVRVHRSALLNLSRVSEWQHRPFRQLVVVLADKTHITVSRSRRTHVLHLLKGQPL